MRYEKCELWKEWKQENTSTENYLEAKKKARRAVYQSKRKPGRIRFRNVMQMG